MSAQLTPSQFLAACLDGRVNDVTQSLAATPDIYKSKNDKGMDGLYFAALKNHAAVVEAILQAGCPPDTVTNEGATPLFVACQLGHTATTKSLLAHDANPDRPFASPEKPTPLFMAAQNGHNEIVQALLTCEQGCDVNKKTASGATPLNGAADHGKLDVVKTLLLMKGHEANPNTANNANSTPLYAATLKNNADIVRVLLDNGADQKIAKSGGFTPLACAAEQGNAGILEMLLYNNQFNNNNSGGGTTSVLDMKTDQGKTPLFLAAEAGKVECVRLLMAAKADVSVRSKENKTALMIAKEKKFGDVVKLIDPNDKDCVIQ